MDAPSFSSEVSAVDQPEYGENVWIHFMQNEDESSFACFSSKMSRKVSQGLNVLNCLDVLLGSLLSAECNVSSQSNLSVLSRPSGLRRPCRR